MKRYHLISVFMALIFLCFGVLSLTIINIAYMQENKAITICSCLSDTKNKGCSKIGCDKKTCTAETVKAEKFTALNPDCKSAILYDAKSKTVIYEKDADARLQIASMTKLMTLLLVFDAIDEGKLSLDEKITISKNSAQTEGSEAFLDEKSQYLVSDLIMTVIVCSANDSAVALAERIAGSEVGFAKLMNRKASMLGLKNTNFVNATGLPAIDHYSSAKDVSIIYSEICDNPIYKKYSKIWMTDLVHPSGRKTQIVNTNRLIKTFEGCDSGKTGHTNQAGYCLSASATRGDMRLVSVIIGSKTSKARFDGVADMFNYGFDNFENKVVISTEKPICTLEIKNAKEKMAEFFVKEDFIKFLKKGDDFEYTIKYDESPLKAPLKAGDGIRKVYVIDKNNIVVFETDLVSKADIDSIKIKEILHKLYKNIA